MPNQNPEQIARDSIDKQSSQREEEGHKINAHEGQVEEYAAAKFAAS